MFTNWGGDSKLCEVKAAMPFLFRYEEGASTEAETFGQPALARFFEVTKEQFDNDDDELGIGCLQAFSVFDWLLTDEQRQESLLMMDKLLARSSYMVMSSENMMSNKRPTIGKKEKKETILQVDNVSSLFA